MRVQANRTVTAEVIPFRQDNKPAWAHVAPPAAADRLPRRSLTAGNGWVLAAQIACSIAVHGVLLAALMQTPPPLPGANVQAMMVDIVVGDNRAVGAAETPVEHPVELQPIEAAEVTPQAVRPDQVRQATVGSAPPQELEPTPQAATQAVAPPEMTAAIAAERVVTAKTESVPHRTPAAKPAHRRVATAVARPQPSRGAGRGGAPAANPNYFGAVAAHLARYKRFPDAARQNGEQGNAKVTFSIDGAGKVTSVRLVHGTGFAPLDREAEAMVWRASPFPAPPARRSLSFTVPVNFSIRTSGR